MRWARLAGVVGDDPEAEGVAVLRGAVALHEAGGGEDLPAMLAAPDYIVRGYGVDDRIVYGTGGVVATGAIPARAGELLADDRVAYVHVRSARNNCFQCRVER